MDPPVAFEVSGTTVNVCLHDARVHAAYRRPTPLSGATRPPTSMAPRCAQAGPWPTASRRMAVRLSALSGPSIHRDWQWITPGSVLLIAARPWMQCVFMAVTCFRCLPAPMRSVAVLAVIPWAY